MSALERLARWSTRRRRLVLAGWVITLVAALGLAAVARGESANNFELPGSESQEVLDLLEKSPDLLRDGIQGRAVVGRQVLPQSVAEQLGVSVDRIDVVTGDTDQFYWGAGTFASRGAVVAGNAINEAAKVVRTKILRLASEFFEAAEEDLELVDGAVRVRGLPERALPLGALATVANPIRYAYGQEATEAALRLVKPRAGAVLEPGEEPGLEAYGYHAPSQATFASGCPFLVIRPDTGTSLNPSPEQPAASSSGTANSQEAFLMGGPPGG